MTAEENSAKETQLRCTRRSFFQEDAVSHLVAHNRLLTASVTMSTGWCVVQMDFKTSRGLQGETNMDNKFLCWCAFLFLCYKKKNSYVITTCAKGWLLMRTEDLKSCASFWFVPCSFVMVKLCYMQNEAPLSTLTAQSQLPTCPLF